MKDGTAGGPWAAQQHLELRFARMGLVWALLSGVLWALNGIGYGRILSAPELADPALWLLAPVSLAAVSDSCGALWLLLGNALSGRLRELGRSLVSRPARMVMLGALCGGPLGMSGYMLGIKFAGPAYVLPITALYPAVASLLASMFLQERMSLRAWIGMLCCIAGAAVIGYAPPEGQTSANFYLGIAFALLATLGWGAEGVLATKGMDLLDPAVALNIRQAVSACGYLCVALPLAGGYATLPTVLAGGTGPLALLISLSVAVSYLFWYKGLNMTGVSRSMAVNITYSLWGLLFSALLNDTPLTPTLLAGAAAITLGMVLVIGNPRDMLQLRSTE